MIDEQAFQLEDDQSQVISQEDFRLQYNQFRPQYERLAINLQQALKAFLVDKQIPYLDVLYRVKDVDSAYEKITRKKYQHPFEQIEDWCGLRVICYYPSDVDKICEVLKEEFDIQTQEDTAKRLAPHEFGYRSTHFILKVKSSWMQPPNYRGLENFKAEIQVRTILMHAWAEVEHKLQYKRADQVPEQFQRKLYFLSAKFEEADGQFEELRDGITQYRTSLQQEVTNPTSLRTLELNLDTLKIVLDEAFPKRQKPSTASLIDLLDELIATGISIPTIVDSYKLTKPVLFTMEKIWSKSTPPGVEEKLQQVGALRASLEITNPQYQIFRKTANDKSGWGEGVRAARALLDKKLNKQTP